MMHICVVALESPQPGVGVWWVATPPTLGNMCVTEYDYVEERGWVDEIRPGVWRVATPGSPPDSGVRQL